MIDIMYDLDIKTDIVKERVNKTLRRAPAVVREYMQHLTEGSGKYVRARAVLMCALDANNNISDDALTFATAVEILHLATLVHDDVMDDADTRRGIPTLNMKYGKRTAVICGDYLFSLCLQILSVFREKEKDEAYRSIDMDVAKIIRRICLGELLQHIKNGDINITGYEYLRIISGKTAALFAGSFYAGAFFAGEPENVRKKYRKLGEYLGMIFQITDDCIDYSAERDIAKKPVRSDYDQGVITLPLIFALGKEPQGSKQIDISAGNVSEIVRHSGGVEYAYGVANRYADKARKLLASPEMARMTDQKRAMLTELFDTVINRRG